MKGTSTRGNPPRELPAGERKRGLRGEYIPELPSERPVL